MKKENENGVIFLDPRSSSECGTVGYKATRDRFARRAIDLAKAKSPKAVYTDCPESALQKYALFPDTITSLANSLSPEYPRLSEGDSYSLEEFCACVDRVRKKLSDCRTDVAEHTYQRNLNILNALEKDVLDSMKGFRGWRINAIRYKFSTAGFSNNLTLHKHRDSILHGYDAVVVLSRQLHGAPTSYHNSSEIKKLILKNDIDSATEISPPQGTITAHSAGGAWHSSPDEARLNPVTGKKMARGALIIKLCRPATQK